MKRLQLLESVIVPALILTLGVIVVQAHAIPYWQHQMGLYVGLAASIGAELIGLYLVYQPGGAARWTGLALVTVMVIVPAWVILEPEYTKWHDTGVKIVAARKAHAEAQAQAEAKLPLLEEDIAAVEVSLREDEAKSAVRAGWKDELERQRLALTELRAERRGLAALLKAPAKVPTPYDPWAAVPTVLPVLLLLTAFQAVNAYALLRISGYRHAVSRPVSPAAEASEAPRAPLRVAGPGLEASPPAEAKHPRETAFHVPAEAEADPPPVKQAAELLGANEVLVKRLQHAVADRKAELGSGRAVCRAYGINDRDLTWLMHHFARKKDGQPTVSDAKLAEMAKVFLSDPSAEANA